MNTDFEIDRDAFVAASGFGLDPVAIMVRQNQQTSLGAGLLQALPHGGRDQLLEVGLPLHGL